MAGLNPIRKAAVWGGLGLLILAACATVRWELRPGIGLSAKQIKKEIDAKLPPGSPRAEVLAWLDSRKIPHTNLSGVKAIMAEMPQKNWIEDDMEIQIYFYFDEDDTLTQYTVDRFQYSS